MLRFRHVCIGFFILSIIVVASYIQTSTADAQKPHAVQRVKLGVENLDEYAHIFKGKRVGLITNATGVDGNLESTIDVLRVKTQLVALYGPEHGVRGNVTAGASIDTVIDEKTGLPVYSLYGSTKKPTPEMLQDIDVLVFDIQDVGARFYTYIYTMAYAMQACSEQGKTFVVLDRPNPTGGHMVEGGLVKEGYQSFIGMYPIPIRHGMTVGELARLFNDEFGIRSDLVVIPMKGWKRSMVWADTGLPWVMTSPNIPTADTALVYSGIGMFGGTNVSEGVGTTRPFELVGAPWINAADLAERMNALHLPGVVFRPVYFTPRFGKHEGKMCGGVQLHITDGHTYQAVKTGIQLLYEIKALGGDAFHFETSGYTNEKVDLATGDDTVRRGTYSATEMLQRWDTEAKAFQQKARKYYLYQ